MKDLKLFGIFGGRKNALILIGLGILTYFGQAEKITSDQLLDAMKWLLGIGVAGHAVEGGMEAIGKKVNGG